MSASRQDAQQALATTDPVTRHTVDGAVRSRYILLVRLSVSRTYHYPTRASSRLDMIYEASTSARGARARAGEAADVIGTLIGTLICGKLFSLYPLRETGCAPSL